MARPKSKATTKSNRCRPARTKSVGAQIPITRRDRAAGKWFTKLVALQGRLRGPNGCPWDREQTHESLRKFLVEEAYEVLDAIEAAEARQFASELGDLLLQVVFHSILAEERGSFTISDVIEGVHTKMIRRHPHVFADVGATTSAAVLKTWEEIKREERREEKGERGAEDGFEDSAVAGIPRSLPAVLEAYELTRRASKVGFDWDNLAGILDKLDEERREIESALPRETAPSDGQAHRESSRRLEEEIGDLLFVCVNIARFCTVDPEIALKRANRKFQKRFQWMEAAAARTGRRFADLARGEKEELWKRSKTKQ